MHADDRGPDTNDGIPVSDRRRFRPDGSLREPAAEDEGGIDLVDETALNGDDTRPGGASDIDGPPAPSRTPIVLANAKGRSEFAVSAGRFVGNAIERNRAKRLLRESLRPRIDQVNPGWDVVLIARRGAAQAKLADINQTVTDLLKKAGVLKEIHDNGN